MGGSKPEEGLLSMCDCSHSGRTFQESSSLRFLTLGPPSAPHRQPSYAAHHSAPVPYLHRLSRVGEAVSNSRSAGSCCLCCTSKRRRFWEGKVSRKRCIFGIWVGTSCTPVPLRVAHTHSGAKLNYTAVNSIVFPAWVRSPSGCDGHLGEGRDFFFTFFSGLAAFGGCSALAAYHV
jgi:hypothetical protein